MVQVIFSSRAPVLMILCLSQGDATTVVPGTKGCSLPSTSISPSPSIFERRMEPLAVVDLVERRRGS